MACSGLAWERCDDFFSDKNKPGAVLYSWLHGKCYGKVGEWDPVSGAVFVSSVLCVCVVLSSFANGLPFPSFSAFSCAITPSPGCTHHRTIPFAVCISRWGAITISHLLPFWDHPHCLLLVVLVTPAITSLLHLLMFSFLPFFVPNFFCPFFILLPRLQS